MTAQASDSLMYGGKRMPLFANPLEQYLDRHPQRRPIAKATFGDISVISTSTDNYRGYVATWSIFDDQLILEDISVCVPASLESTDEVSVSVDLGSVIPDVTPPILADWFTGELRVPHGEMNKYIHAGYASEFERYLVFQVENGQVASTMIAKGGEYSGGGRGQTGYRISWRVAIASVFLLGMLVWVV